MGLVLLLNMRTIQLLGFLLLAAGCMGGDISLEDLYKRADEAARPPPPPPRVDAEAEAWSTDSLLGWNAPKENGQEILNSIFKDHTVTEDQALGNTKKTHKIKKVKPVKQVQQVQKIKKIKTIKPKKAKKAIKVALVTKGLAKKKKVKKAVHPDAIVPEAQHANMLAPHFFDSATAKPVQHKTVKHTVKVEKKTSTSDLLSGMHLMGMGSTPQHTKSSHSLTALSSNLLGDITKHEQAKVKKATKVKKVKKAKKIAAKIAAKKKKADPLHMDLGSVDTESSTSVPDEKKLPSLGSMLNMDDDDDDF